MIFFGEIAFGEPCVFQHSLQNGLRDMPASNKKFSVSRYFQKHEFFQKSLFWNHAYSPWRQAISPFFVLPMFFEVIHTSSTRIFNDCRKHSFYQKNRVRKRREQKKSPTHPKCIGRKVAIFLYRNIEVYSKKR